MCLAVPARIKRIHDNLTAEVEMGGAGLTVSLALTPEARVGEYVIVHTGFAITILDEEEAMETLRLFAEIEPPDVGPQGEGSEGQ
jgi:hydrogenase expression/formation protein HypC